MNFNRMTIGRRMWGLCFLLLIFCGLLGGAAIFAIGRLHHALAVLVTDAMPGVLAGEQIGSITKDIRGKVMVHAVEQRPEQKQAADEQIQELQRKLERAYGEYDKACDSAEDRAIFDRVKREFGEFWRISQQTLALSRSGKNKEAVDNALTEGLPAFARYDAAVNELVEVNQRHGDADMRSAIELGESSLNYMVAFLGLAVVGGLVMSLLLTRSISRCLRELSGRMMESVFQVSDAAAQVARGGTSLAEGTSVQAATLQETSASSEELRAITLSNDENATKVAGLMTRMNGQVASANSALGQMEASMHAITESSNRISKIIQVIEGIAFQTNILALNAAVEAARAGDAGMGFAVVAEEVRSLAQRCAQAAKDTSALIEESIVRSGAGRVKLTEVAHAIGSLTEGNNQVRDLVGAVTTSSREQAKGIAQIAVSIAQLDKVTQTAAASAEESAAAGQQLSAMAESMKHLVGSLEEFVGAQR